MGYFFVYDVPWHNDDWVPRPMGMAPYFCGGGSNSHEIS
jgi:hypothetical protein